MSNTRAGQVDTDGDGVTDTDEIAAGTLPNNAQSVQWKSLGSWRFTDGTLTGDNGQQPIAQNNVTVISNGFPGPAVQFLPGPNVSLKYRAVEPSGQPNISAVRGSIWFRFSPKWNSEASGPGSTITLLQTTNWALRINARGTNMLLVSFSGGVTNTNCVLNIDLGSFGAYWSYVLLTYSPERSSLEVDFPLRRVTGTGIPPPANFNDPNNFISIGSAPDGTGAINGSMDEIVAFNAEGMISLTPSVISAVASNSPPGINLLFSSPTNALMQVQRRVVGASTWEITRASFGTNFFDTNVIAGQRYEYHLNSGVSDLQTGSPDDFGESIKASLKGSPFHNRGKIILLVDKTLSNAIEPELSGFTTNLIGDGWQVLRLEVPRHIDDFSSNIAFRTNYFIMTNVIKPFINSNYALFGPEIKYILAIGHIPVAYTGTIADDGHNTADGRGRHTGAWANDFFYGDVDGIWTDTTTVTSSSFQFNWNFPSDGRLDQNKIPNNSTGVAKLEIPVARLDLSFMPSFTDSEAVLLKKYFKKDADYRNGLRTFAADCLNKEYLPIEGTMTPDLGNDLVSKVSVLKQSSTGDIFTDTRSLLFGVQSGAGFFDRINDSLPGIEHTTPQIATGQYSTNCAFYFLRGSYFPDWNTQDNFMRAPLGMTNGGLTCGAFLGLSKGWRVTGLGVGDSIGADMADIVNSWFIVGNIQSPRSIELLGDPTLHYPILPPPTALTWKVTNNAVSLTWFNANGASGYYVYRSSTGINGTFQQITDTPVTAPKYTDTAPPAGNIVYMIRAAASATTGAGTFTNLSQGVFSRPITSADPDSCCIGPQNILEDAPPLAPLPFSIGEAGSESGLLIFATSSNPALVPNGNIFVTGSGANRSVQVSQLTNQFGASTITITALTDLSTVVRVFTLTVDAVNDAPVFTTGPDITLAQGANAQTINGWATGISAGPPNESSQQLTFVVTNDSPYLFSAQPAISAAGRLTFSPVRSERGNALVSVQLQDDGGTANGGVDSSYIHTFNIALGLPLDTDGDGLPDDFELLYGFDPNTPGDGAADWDGDGMTNLQELEAGTNPKDSRSALRINSAASQSPTFALVFDSVAGKSYSFDANDNFPSTGTWQTLSSPIPGTGSPIEQLDADAGNSTNRVYRVTTEGGSLATEYAGLRRFALPGNSDTVVSLPFIRPAVELGAVVAVIGNSVQVRGTPGWQANQWAYSSGSQSNTHFMLIRSGAAQGDIYTIIANTTDTLRLDLQGNSLVDLRAGDSVAVVPYWTVGTLFHAGDGANASPSPANRQTEVLIPNIDGTGINLSAAATYYFWNGAWRRVGFGDTVNNDDVILPDMYVIVRHNVGTGTTLTAEGAVLAGDLRLNVRRNSNSTQDNLLGLPRPVSVSLNDAGLVDLIDPASGAFRTSPSPGNRTDELIVFDNTAVARNKSAAGTYYFWNAAWRKVGSGSADRGGDMVFQPGAGIIIRSGTGNDGVIWTNAPTY